MKAPSPRKAIGIPPENGTLRLSLSRDITEDDVRRAVRILVEEARALRPR